MSTFAVNLKKIRKSKKVSQKVVAQQLGYGYTAVANYESGRNEPSIDDLIKIADFFQVSMDVLVGREYKLRKFWIKGRMHVIKTCILLRKGYET